MHPGISRMLNFLNRNAPTLLTISGCVGVVGTAALAAHATVKAHNQLYRMEMNRKPEESDIPFKDLAVETWTYYIPTAVMATATIGCIVGTHSIHVRRGAALTAMYTMADTAFKEYKDQVVKQFGSKKEKKIREGVQEDRLQEKPPVNSEVIVVKSEGVMCYDEMSGRYFKANLESLRKAENDINFQIYREMYASLNTFYSKIGLGMTKLGEEVGWNNDRPLELEFTTILSEGDQPCVCLNYRVQPFAQYASLH